VDDSQIKQLLTDMKRVAVVDAAVARQDGAVWMQEGVENAAAATAAEAADIPVIMDRCLYKEWLRLLNG